MAVAVDSVAPPVREGDGVVALTVLTAGVAGGEAT